jgi:hypothetical protein
MNWLLQLYPARWRERYGEEFGAVLATQRASVGLMFDVLGQKFRSGQPDKRQTWLPL